MVTLSRLAVSLFLLASLAACDKLVVPSTDGSVANDSGAPGIDAGDCEGTLDSCGVCDGNDTDKDCEGTCFGNAATDMCGKCDTDPNNDCLADCNDELGGTATLDDCGTCDSDPSNDCWLDGITGTLTIPDSDNFDLGTGNMFWSGNSAQRGFFYSGLGFTNPPVRIANVTMPGLCGGSDPGYEGLGLVTDLTNTNTLSLSSGDVVVKFGTQNETSCNQGLLVFEQGGRFGVIEFVDISATLELTIRFWIANAGVTDFSGAPL